MTVAPEKKGVQVSVFFLDVFADEHVVVNIEAFLSHLPGKSGRLFMVILCCRSKSGFLFPGSRLFSLISIGSAFPF